MAYSEGMEPEARELREALARFFALDRRGALQTPEGKALRTGEARRWRVKSWGDLPGAPGTVRRLDRAHAVARTLHRTAEGAEDQYVYLTKEEGLWKVSALRTFPNTGSIRHLLRGASPAAPLSALRLMVATDAELRQYFLLRRSDFEALRRRADQVVAARLMLRQVVPARSGRLDCIVSDTQLAQAGFLYLPDDRPPPVQPQAYFWVEKLLSRWYLYRRFVRAERPR